MKFYVSFHVGSDHRNGLYGHLTFIDEENFQELLARCMDVCTIWNTDEYGNPLPDAYWELLDQAGNTILEGRDEIEALTGVLEWDGNWDTDYVTTTDNLNEREKEALWNAYLNGEYMSDELKNEVCSLKGKKRAGTIKRYPDNVAVEYQDAVESIDIDGQIGQFTREEWEDYLADKNWCPFSIERILDYMDKYCNTNNEDFFAEED